MKQDMKDGITKLIDAELEAADEQYSPLFNSPHEAYAVLLEEVEEAGVEFESIVEEIKDMWECIKSNNSSGLRAGVVDLEDKSLLLAYEVIQVGAMVKKFRRMWESGKRN